MFYVNNFISYLQSKLIPLYQELVVLFHELDDNKDGMVTFEEFLKGLRMFKETLGHEDDVEGEMIVKHKEILLVFLMFQIVLKNLLFLSNMTYSYNIMY